MLAEGSRGQLLGNVCIIHGIEYESIVTVTVRLRQKFQVTGCLVIQKSFQKGH